MSDPMIRRGGQVARLGCSECDDTTPMPDLRCVRCGTGFHGTEEDL